MVNSSQFSKRLQKILDYYGVSATAFSEIISFNRSTISHLLSGRNKPSLEFVMKVLEAYPEVELYWLLNGKGTFPSTQKNEVSKISDTLQKPESHHNFISENHNVNQKKISEVPKNFENSLNPISGKSKNGVYEISEEKKLNSVPIDRIVIFYKDGTFSEFKN
ncbi:transcriptional regulator [Patiriisocius marinistellae]|uniref:Transcriptional regulator n=1 Tax=Patiriisocius marinistellae TaxID=2494560 RepID=A0A5J4FV03_9FLAO|nr:helix-turn-helix transcriptional regulator [Patiriisocius marinistellae]GEQ86517.1 transcriptional regulator [Patiriisocius marinistellae]